MALSLKISNSVPPLLNIRNSARDSDGFDIDIEAGRTYLDRCLRITEAQKSTDIIDKTILGDLFEVTSFFPVKFVDLLIADPPYNLDKNFHGNKFKKTSDELYEEYTEKWIQAVLPILKEIEDFLETINSNIKVAVMGCVVNGPGEAKDADIGIAGGIGEVLLFKKGNPVRKIKEENVVEEFKQEILNLVNELKA